MRGPFIQTSDNVGLGTLTVMGGFLLDPRVLILAQRVTAPTAVVDPWHAPVVKPAAAANLTAASGSYLTTADANSTGLSAVASTRDLVPGPRWINFDGWIYYLGCDSTAAVANSYSGNYVVRPCQLCNTPPNSISLTGYPLVPRGALDLKGYQSRIWLAGGIDVPGAGATFSPTTIFFSNPITGGVGAGHGGVAADWEDPVALTTNQIVMDRNFDDPVVGFGVLRNGLVVFRRSSVWLLKGTTTANYTIVPVSREVGCLDIRSVIECDAGIYFMTHRGLFLTDGTKVVDMSGTVKYTLMQAIQVQQFALYQSPPFPCHIECALLSDGSILVNIGAGAHNSPSINPIWCAMFSPATRTWTRITSNTWLGDTNGGFGTLGYPGHLISRIDQRQLYTIGERYVTQLEDIAIGTSFIQISNVYNSFLYDANVGATTWTSIPAVWTTRISDLITNTTLTRKYTQAKRFFADYQFSASADIINASALQVTPINAAGVTYAGSPLVLTPGSGAGVATSSIGGGSIYNGGVFAVPTVRRKNQDFQAEVDDLLFKVAWQSSTDFNEPGPVYSSGLVDLYGIGVEGQPTRDLR